MMDDKTRKWVIGTIVFLSLIVFWELSPESILFPSPTQVISAFFSLILLPDTWSNIFSSIVRVYVSIFFVLILGMIIGSSDFFSKNVASAIKPLFYPTQYISSAVWSIIAIIIFGLSTVTAYFIIIIVVLPNIFVAVQIGMKNLNKKLMEMGSIYTGSKIRTFRHLVFPQLIPHVLVGLIRSNAIAWKIVVTAEIFISVDGLGYMVNNYYHLLNIPKLFATVLIIIFIGLVLDIMFRLLINKVGGRYLD